ncbi:hypothetical protein EMIT0P2_130149 [Pseudomonas sp. IT-P2]
MPRAMAASVYAGVVPALAPQNTQTDVRDMPSSWVNRSQGNGWHALIQGLDFAFRGFTGAAGATGVSSEQTAQQAVEGHDGCSR